MSYQELSIHQRVNAKGNASVYYYTFNPKFTDRLPYGKMVLKRVSSLPGGYFNPSRLLPLKTN